MWSYCHCWGVLRHMGQYSMRIYSASCGFFVCHCWLFAVQVLWRGNDLLEWTGLTFLSSLLGNLKLFALIRLVADLHNFPGSALALESGVRCALILLLILPLKGIGEYRRTYCHVLKCQNPSLFLGNSMSAQLRLITGERRAFSCWQLACCVTVSLEATCFLFLVMHH